MFMFFNTVNMKNTIFHFSVRLQSDEHQKKTKFCKRFKFLCIAIDVVIFYPRYKNM